MRERALNWLHYELCINKNNNMEITEKQKQKLIEKIGEKEFGNVFLRKI